MPRRGAGIEKHAAWSSAGSRGFAVTYRSRERNHPRNPHMRASGERRGHLGGLGQPSRGPNARFGLALMRPVGRPTKRNIDVALATHMLPSMYLWVATLAIIY